MHPTLVRGLVTAWIGLAPLVAAAADVLPFRQKVEVYRDKEGDVMAFALRLEQPFFGEEFQEASYLRLQPTDSRTYLVYPKETKFQQKHAEFYGRLRGEGTTKLRLSYKTVSEGLDGSRQVEVREAEIEVPIPAAPDPPEAVGSRSIYLDWARQQNQYFADLLRYYPEETFYQYALLQSKARYGVEPPPIPKAMPDRTAVETDLYQFFTGSTAIQDVLQREALSSPQGPGDLEIPLGNLSPPRITSLPYEELLEKKRTEEKIEPQPLAIARLVPEDQYLIHFNSIKSLGEVFDLATQWGDGLLRLFTVQAEDHRLQTKLEDQLCIRREPLEKLFGEGVISEVAVTGADPFVLEGTDVTMIFRVERPEVFDKAAAGWLEEVRQKYPDMADREFNYRGHKVDVHYTKDRVVSALVVRHENYVIYSNSHRAVRRVIEASAGLAPALFDALDYRYVSTILPPSPKPDAGYLYVSEAMIKRMVGPEMKISEKRRLQCYNNLVMLNNASLFYRLEYGRSPETLSDLVEGRFVDAGKIVCPHGGAYALDAEHGTCTCSLHNRLKYLTPNVELGVLQVSRREADEYERYKQRYQAFWQNAFDPIAVRITAADRVKLEACILPFANGGTYAQIRQALDKNPQPLSTARIAPSAVQSIVLVPGREKVAAGLRTVPGVAETLAANPALADLKWVGDRVSLHFCDGEALLQIDPTQFGAERLPMLGDVPVEAQVAAAALLAGLELPVYATIDVENRERAAQLLDELSQQIFLKRNPLFGIETKLDAYRLPDYKGHAVYVFTGQLYALKLRLHVALVGDQLVAATTPEVLHEVIDAGTNAPEAEPAVAHVLLRFNRKGLKQLLDDVQRYWEEKARVACHRNIISIYNLVKLYDVPVDQVPQLSEAKYGVRYFCPDGGEYRFDAERDQVFCSVHGNRRHARQDLAPEQESSFARSLGSLDEIVATLRFGDDALITTVEIVRSKKEP